MRKDEVTVMPIDAKLLSKKYKELAEENGLATNEVYLLPLTHKKRFKALAIAMQQLTDCSNMGERWDMNEELICEFKRLLACVNYLINSTSFRKGDKYYDFDRIEINRKLGRR